MVRAVEDAGRRRGVSTALAALLLWTAVAGCASPSPVAIEEVQPNAPVRLEESRTDDGQPNGVERRGRFEGYDTQRIYLSVPGRTLPDTISWNDVQRLRVNAGRQIGAGIVFGMWGGLAVGWGALHLIQPEEYGWIILPLMTVPAGGLLGAIFAPESWAPVNAPP